MEPSGPELEAARIDLDGLLRPGDTVVWGQGPAEPGLLVEALLDQQDRLAPVTAIVGTVISDRLRSAAFTGLKLKGFIPTGDAGALADAGVLDVLPCSTSDLPRLIARGRLPVDGVLLQLSPADEHGNHSLGLAGDYLREAIDAARVVIGEVNPRVPFTMGDSLIPHARLDLVVESRAPLLEVPARPHRRAEREIAAHAADLIPDGAVLQIGIGQTPDAILDALWDKRNLGVHSGMITDRVARLMEAGVVTNAHKAIDRGVTVTGTLFGTEAGLYAYADRNDRIALRSAAYTHDAARIALLDRFTAINGAIEVDLTGQVNTEATASRTVGAVGGQLDFARGAFSARDGRSIVALGSTAPNGSASRIVAALARGVVSTPRSCADLVITEYGVAELRGATLWERAERLVAVAHPDARRELARDARRLFG